MSLTRREILEQLSRLGIRTIDGLKRSCREYETYWSNILGKQSGGFLPDQAESLMHDQA